MPDLPMVPEPLRGRVVLHVRVAYLGDADQGAQLIAPLRECAPPLIDAVAEMPVSAVGAIYNDPVDPTPVLERTALLTELPDEALQAVLDTAGPAAQEPVALLELRHLEGALSEPPRIPNAVSVRDGKYNLLLVSILLPGTNAATLAPALDRGLARFTAYGDGRAMLNAMGTADSTPNGTTAAYDAGTYRRLAELKAKYDPANLFRFNHNIPPAGN